MEFLSKLKDTANQVFAIVEKELKLKLRFKGGLILKLISPIFTIIMPLIVMGQLFTFREGTNFGPWTGENFLVFQFVASQLYIIFSIRNSFHGNLKTEKYWYTLQALIIAPFKRVNLLLGFWMTHLILSSTGLLLFFVLTYIVSPISLFTIFAVLFVYLLSYLAFSGVGLILGILAISKENILPFVNFGLGLFFLFSTLNLPFEFFPSYIQLIIDLNPLFYMVNFTRLIWLEDNFILSIVSHPFSFSILLFSGIISPFIGLKIFNYVFDKYGIVGY